MPRLSDQGGGAILLKGTSVQMYRLLMLILRASVYSRTGHMSAVEGKRYLRSPYIALHTHSSLAVGEGGNLYLSLG